MLPRRPPQIPSSSLLAWSRKAPIRVPRAPPFRRAIYCQTKLIDAIKEDHREMCDYYKAYVESSGDRDAQERWARLLTWEIVRHAIGEEIVVYPLIESCLGELGAELTDQDRESHQFVKERLYRLEYMTPGSLEHAALLKEIMDHLSRHNRHEENEDLPLLEPILGKEASLIAASDFSRTKRFAPTRSHPAAPNEPPFETLFSLMTAPLDKLKDAFAKFPTEDMKKELMKKKADLR
ncbi:hypothetical protein FPV67DRAFT_1417438 [Lyophyllum atratum]|nr:hypothetical protein FPV67DRAFT_1417438 [Lyophyllum atratum]